MNILVLNWRDPKHPLAGGAEISLHEHIKYWQKKRAKVTWYAGSFEKSKSEEIVDGIKIIRKGNHYTVALNFYFDWILGKFRNTDLIVDCFHFISFMTPLYTGKTRKIALINEVAGKLWFGNLPAPIAYIGYKIEPLIIKMYKEIKFITGSESAKKDLLKIGIQSNMVTVINHGIDPPKKSKNFVKELNPTLIFLGRISRDKGIEDALEMLARLIVKNNKIVLWIVGKYESDSYKIKINKIIDTLKINKNLVFFGYVDNALKNELLQRSWLLIHPSVKEGWGLNVIEANQVGTPAIGYNVAGLRDSILNNKTGVLVNPNVKSLAEGVNMLLKDNQKLRVMGSEAKKWSTNFSWEKAGKISYDLLTKVCND